MNDGDSTFQWYHFGAGWFSGICGMVVGHPLDTIKVRQQAQSKGIAAIISSILKKDGILGFYKGMFMPLVTTGVMNSVYFGIYGNSLRLMANYHGQAPLRHCCDSESTAYKYYHWDVFCSGCVAGLATTIGMCPVELSKIKLQTQSGIKSEILHREKYSGTLDFLIKTFRAGGFRSLFVGLPAMLVRDVPSFGIYALAYEHTACLSAELLNTHHTSTVCVLLGGTSAGIWSWAMVVPVDVVKSRIQADSSHSPKYKGMWDCVMKSYKEDGAKVFMRGFWMTMIRAMPVNAATFFGYEMFINVYLNWMRT